jgi:hypothetical protein
VKYLVRSLSSAGTGGRGGVKRRNEGEKRKIEKKILK